MDRGRSNALLVFDCKFTYCFTAHMHEIPKYVLSTEKPFQQLQAPLDAAIRLVLTGAGVINVAMLGRSFWELCICKTARTKPDLSEALSQALLTKQSPTLVALSN